ncbi:MAG: phosphatase PAP2 family protein [Prevotellaceae bacterium]|jgi:membrane-associated phospholipid phosphatase|nr:phosphatase PAP2 family protein [Prevotellaceae bacterium]
MKKISIFIIVLIFLSSSLSHSQIHTSNIPVRNSANAKISFKPFVIPAIFISYGIATRITKPLRGWDNNVAKNVIKRYKHFTHADDYIQYTSYAAVYGLGLSGIKAKHNFVDRTFIVATSSIITGIIVQTMKRTTLIKRPDGHNFNSFPSGHTATAFVGAHILYKEYKDVSTWIGFAGYGAALTTGSMRILNNRHWFSDVITGAGIGILSVELSYLLLPAWHKLSGKEKGNSDFAIVPIISNKQIMFGLTYRF